MASLRDIAAECQLSINAVSEILNRGNEARYRPETCERVRAVASRLNYVPNRAAQSMRSRRSRVVGFVTENTSSNREAIYHPSIYSFVVGLSHAMIDAGHHLAVLDLFELAPSGDPQSRVLEEVFFDGLIVHQGRHGSQDELERRVDVPVVWYDAQIDGPVRQVRRDELQVGRELVEHLYALGHRQIAFAMPGYAPDAVPAGVSFNFSMRDRVAGYHAAMHALGLQPIMIPTLGAADLGATLRARNITALITEGTSEFASVVMAANLVGMQVPRDLSWAACDVDDRRDYGGLQLGGMRYDRYAAGQQAAAMLLRLIAAREDEPPTVKMPGVFQPGDTVIRVTPSA